MLRGTRIHRLIQHHYLCPASCSCPPEIRLPGADEVAILGRLDAWLVNHGFRVVAAEVSLRVGFLSGRTDLVIQRVSQPASVVLVELKTGYRDITPGDELSWQHISQVAYNALLWEDPQNRARPSIPKRVEACWIFYLDHPIPAVEIAREVVETCRTRYRELVAAPGN